MCTCQRQFRINKIGEGKYSVSDHCLTSYATVCASTVTLVSPVVWLLVVVRYLWLLDRECLTEWWRAECKLVHDVVVWRVAEDASGEDLTQYCDGESRRRLDGARWVPRQERPLSRLVSCSLHSAHCKLELFSCMIWRAYRICQVGLLQ